MIGGFSVFQSIGSLLADPYGHALLAPVAGRAVEATRALSAAGEAFPAVIEIPGAEPVPVPFDHERAAPMTKGRPAARIDHVAGIGMADAVGSGDLSRATQALRRGGWFVVELEIRVERGEVHGYVRTQALHHPTRHFVDFRLRVVFPWNQKGGELEPDLGLRCKVLEGLEHRFQVAPAEFFVEVFGEGLEIDVGGVHRRKELRPRFRTDLTGRHGHRGDPGLAAGLGDIHRILEKDHRVVIGEGHRSAAGGRGGTCDGLRRGRIRQGVGLSRFGNGPVLAKFAGQVAPGGSEGEDRGARVEVVEWLLFDRVDAETGRAAVGCQGNLAADILAHETESALSLFELAQPRAKLAHNTTVVERLPIATWDHRFHISIDGVNATQCQPAVVFDPVSAQGKGAEE